MRNKKTTGGDPPVEETRYTKGQLLNASRYKQQRDLLAALLADGRTYRFLDVDEAIHDYMKGKVN